MNRNNNIDLKDERDFLNDKSNTYRKSIYHNIKRGFIINTFKPYITKIQSKKEKRVGVGLQLGCSSDGYETKKLSKILDKLDVIEGSSIFIERCKEKNLGNVRFFNMLFKDFEVSNEKKKYDFIFCTYVLEHVLDPVKVLKMIKSVIKPDGLLFIVVPNCRACSRQLALYMNLIPGLKDLTDNDINHGHRRTYDRISLIKEIEKSDFKIIQIGGVIFKILADFQLDILLEDKFLNKSHIEGLFKLGLEYPDFADSIYAICNIKD